MNNYLFDNLIKDELNKQSTKVPNKVKQRIDKTLKGLPNKNPGWKALIYTAAAIILPMVLIFSLAFVSPTVADAFEDIPIIESIFRIAGDIGLKKADENKFTTTYSISDTDKGIAITISEAIYNQTRLAIGYTQASNKEMGSWETFCRCVGIEAIEY